MPISGVLPEISDDDIDVMVRTLAGEARGEPIDGQTAVAWVILNRAMWTPPAYWGANVEDVCYHKYAFSCWNGGPDTDYVENLSEADDEYKKLKAVCESVIDDDGQNDPTDGATFYHTATLDPLPKWARIHASRKTGQFGHQIFYAIGPTE